MIAGKLIFTAEFECAPSLIRDRGLDPHGLLDEKDAVTDSIHCTTEVKVSSERAHQADANDMV